MTTITINEKTAKGKTLLDFLEKFGDPKTVKIERKPNTETLKAMADVKAGKVTKANNVNDLMQKLRS